MKRVETGIFPYDLFKVKEGMTKISHSARGKYDFCPQMYNLHYNEKIRPLGTTSSLLFGSAIDKAAEHYLLTGNREEANDLFYKTWNEQEVNGILATLSTCKEISFHINDFDHELLTKSDNELVVKDTVYSTPSDLVEAGENKERIVLANWFSLYRKGLILINGFMNWVDNNVEEVLEAQCEVELEDGEGNEITGKVDFVLKMKNYNVPLVVDLKTAARFYERNSVKQSEQLALYFFYLKNTKYEEMKRAAYLVLQKQIKKNRIKTCLVCGTVTTGLEKSCAAEKEDGVIARGKNKGQPKMVRCEGEFSVVINPEATIQFIHDEIPEEFIEDTIEGFSKVVAKIKAGQFEKNPDGCDSYYGRECPYKKYCESGCMDGLIKREDK